jgi:hypothetical protein
MMLTTTSDGVVPVSMVISGYPRFGEPRDRVGTQVGSDVAAVESRFESVVRAAAVMRSAVMSGSAVRMTARCGVSVCALIALMKSIGTPSMRCRMYDEAM